MTTYTCPQGHQSTSADYCDTCGAPIPTGAESAPAGTPAPDAAPQAPAAPATQDCPNCGTPSAATALFCEACGYDFTTGSMPRPPDATQPIGQPAAAPAPSPGALSAPIAPEWVAELWVDPDWYAVQSSDDPCPSPGLPVVVPLTTQSVLVGRPSVSRSIHPDVDCSSDTGVSRRQAQLTTDGQRWWVEDLQSSNGTYVGPASGPLPTAPVPPGQRRELGDDDRVYIGTWTRLVVRRATPEEKAGQSS
jgi:FHA domain/Double zinc ribbon